MTTNVTRIAGFVISAAYILTALSAAAATIRVTPATFDSAIAAAKGGDRLDLVGTFGPLKIQDLDFANRVTINANRATFTSTVVVRNVANLWFGGGTFNITGASDFTKAAAVYGGSNITFNGVKVTGSAGGEGITFNGTTGASVSSGTFKGLQVAVVLGSVTTGNVTRNMIVGAVSDGIDIADSHGVSASYNTCSGGKPGAGAHPDCIQLWSVTGQPLQSHIVVRNNTATGPTQGFTAFDSMGGEQQIQIINNSVNTSFSQGVACYECFNSNISYNALATLPGAPHLTNLNIIGGGGNVVVGNTIKPYPRRLAPESQFATEAYGAGPDIGLATVQGDTPDLAALVGAPPLGDTAGVAAVPEPSSWALLLTGLVAVGVASRRRVMFQMHDFHKDPTANQG